MIDEIHKLFKDEFILQSSSNEIIIDLSEKGENCRINIAGRGEFIEIKDTLIESLGNRLFKGKLGENHCDGIVFNHENGRLNLILIEYKHVLGGIKTFIKICHQLNATYLKVSALFNLLYKIKDINVIYVYVGKIPESTQSIVLASKTKNPKLYERFVRKKEAIIEVIPFDVNILINDDFRKASVKFIHSECNSGKITI